MDYTTSSYFQSQIANDCLKMSIDGYSWPQLVPKLLLQVSVWGLHNSMVSPPEEGILEESRDVDNNIIISNSTLRSIIPPQLKNISSRYKVVCVFECWISAKIIHSSLLSWRDLSVSKLNNLSQNLQNRRSGEKANRIF